MIYEAYVPLTHNERVLHASFPAVLSGNNIARFLWLCQEAEHIPEPLEHHGFRNRSYHGKYLFLGCDNEGNLVSRADCFPLRWPDQKGESQVLVKDLVVLPSARKNGFGREILQKIMDRMPTRGLSQPSGMPPFTKLQAVVSPSPKAASSFLLRCGWQPVKNSAGLYEHRFLQEDP